MSIVTTKPAALMLDAAAAYLSLSPAMVQQMAQSDDDFPKPVQLSLRRVAWRTDELDAWLAKRPRSSVLPPKGSGYGRKGAAADSSARASLRSQATRSAS